MKNNILTKIIFLFVCIIITFVSNFCYALTITQEEFKNNFTESISGNYRANISEDKIELKLIGSDVEVCTINYELLENPTFTIGMNFNDKMTFDEYTDETAKYAFFAYCLIALKSNLQKDVGEYPGIYFGSATASLLENNNIEKKDYTSDMAIISAKKDFKDKTINDDNFKLTFKTIEDTSSKFEVEAIFELKLKDSTTNIEKNSNELTVEENKNDIANLSILPKTGEEANGFVTILYVLIGVCIIGVIVLFYILKRKK